MLFPRLNRDSRAFTIVEVIIVLAIAGLIMMVIFLAVPALQRSSRNTQYKADASNIISLVSQFAANRSGALPDVLCLNGTTVTAANGTCASPTNTVTTTVSRLTTSVTFDNPLPTCLSGCNAAVGTIKVFGQAVCNNNTYPAIDNSGSRQYVAWFGLESGNSSTTNQCIAP